MFCPNPECPHRERTGEPAEYREGIDRCQDCGSPLAEESPSKDERPEYEEFVPVFEIPGAALVPFVESLLQSASIHFFIKGESLQDLFGWGRLGTGFNIVTGPPKVFVEPERADEARELLEGVGEAVEPDVSEDAGDDGELSG